MLAAGEYRRMNQNAYEEDTPYEERVDGWYEFQSSDCNFSLELNSKNGSIYFSRYDCKDGTLAYEGILRAAVQTRSLPVVVAEQLGEGRLKDWGAKPNEESEDGPPEMWVWESTMCEGLGEAKASSSLPPQGVKTYSPKNIHDDNPTTVWVEGKADYGVGEYLEFNMVSIGSGGLYILNGYQSSTTAWENNSRVKQLQVSVNGVIVCLVDLADRMGVQHFELPSRALELTGSQGGDDVIRFTIMEVYPGLKWKDTAISEIWTCGG